MAAAAALASFAPFVFLLLQRVATFAAGNGVAHARANELRLHIDAICHRARTILERLRDGTLRRHIDRRRPPKCEPNARNAAWLESPFPTKRYWLPRMIEETVPMAGLLEQWAANSDLPDLFARAPQLRRALSPLFTMLGQRLPKAAAQPRPQEESGADSWHPPEPPPEPPPGPPPEPPAPQKPLPHPNGFYLGWLWAT